MPSPARFPAPPESFCASEDPLLRSLWQNGRALAAVGLQAQLKAADLSLVPAAAGAALRQSEALLAAPAFGADPALWSADPLAPLEAFRLALKTALDRALGQDCQVSARPLLTPAGDTLLLACAAIIPEPIDMSQWGAAQSRLRALLRIAGVPDPMERARNAIHCSLEDRLDDWIEEIAVEASPPPQKLGH